MKDYDDLRNQYPETISLDQLYRICNIAKRSAAYLIRHGVIPAEDTGRKTWRYRIRLEDVIAYLRKRDRFGSMIPRGAVSSRYGERGRRVSYGSLLIDGDVHQLTEYFTYIYFEYPDILTIEDIVEMTGLSSRTIFKFIHEGDLKVLERHPRYLVAKAHLLMLVRSKKFIDCKSNSENFKRILGGFAIWKNAKS
jgi:hypothetical protein